MFKFLSQGAFLTKCKLAGVKNGLTEGEAKSLVDSFASLLLEYHSNKLKPEAALGVLCGMILKDEREIPGGDKGVAYNYAKFFVSVYPLEQLSEMLRPILETYEGSSAE